MKSYFSVLFLVLPACGADGESSGRSTNNLNSAGGSGGTTSAAGRSGSGSGGGGDAGQGQGGGGAGQSGQSGGAGKSGAGGTLTCGPIADCGTGCCGLQGKAVEVQTALMCKTWIAMGPTTLVGCFAPAPGGSCAHQTAPNCYKYTMGDKTLYVSSNATFPQITKAETPWEDCGFMSSEEAEAFGLPDCP